MTKKHFKVATLPCAVAVALLGGSVLFSCSGDDETGVDESDFSASQFETLASRRMTRSAESGREILRIDDFTDSLTRELSAGGTLVCIISSSKESEFGTNFISSRGYVRGDTSKIYRVQTSQSTYSLGENGAVHVTCNISYTKKGNSTRIQLPVETFDFNVSRYIHKEFQPFGN